MSGATGLQVVGGLMVLAGVIWAATGFYASNAPALIALLVVGGGLSAAGAKLKDRRQR